MKAIHITQNPDVRTRNDRNMVEIFESGNIFGRNRTLITDKDAEVNVNRTGVGRLILNFQARQTKSETIKIISARRS